MCDVSDEFHSLCVSWLPSLNLVCLDLSFSTITILPLCIKECHRLKKLYVRNCNQLEVIEGMPPNLELLDAQNCLSLTFQSSTMLMHQGFCKFGKRKFMLPGEEVPEWFHHCSDGYSAEFWVYKEFPELAVCVAIATLDDMEQVNHIFLRVNNSTMLKSSIRYKLWKPEKDHILLCHVQRNLLKGQLKRLFFPDQWNHVEILGYYQGTIKSIGVHVYERENVQFSRPTSLKNVHNSNNDLMLGCHPLMKKRLLAQRQENINSNTSWQEPHLPYVNVDSNSTTIHSTSDTISDQDGEPMQSFSQKQPYKIEMKIRLPTIPENDNEEDGLKNNHETFNPPDFKTNEVSLNTSMDLEALNKMIKEAPVSAIESLLTEKELKSLLTRFELSSLINDDMHRSNIYLYIEDLEKKFESLPPAHQSFLVNFRSFFVNAASNYDKLNEVRKKEFQLKVEKEDVEKKLQEARAKDEKMTALVSSASLSVKEIASSIEELEGQLMKLKQEKGAFELAINECGKQKEILRTGCISWVNQSKDLFVELTKTEETAQALEDRVKADETNFQELVASVPF